MPALRMNNVWDAIAPSEWPKPPRWMSFSTLAELEACPRRWALKSANYPNVWERQGYPSVPNSAALEGLVVHSAIERIVSALAERGCASLREKNAVDVLMELGGYTGIVGDCIARAVRQFEDNPRADPVIESVRQGLTRRIPELRTRVQRQVSRIQPEGRVSAPLGAAAGHRPGGRSVLREGSHAEVELRVPEMGWHGFVDLLTLSAASCEIRDFKTGAVKELDRLQLITYALLWARDRELNPSGRLADRLVLSYSERDVEVAAPNTEALRAMADEIRNRTSQVLATIQPHAPAARPNSENCRHCTVRHLCDEYWEWPGRYGEDREASLTGFGDVEIELTGQHGPSSWDGTVVGTSAASVRKAILLRVANPQFDLHGGQRIRVLNVHLNEPDDEEGLPIIATSGTRTEMFLVTL